MTPPCSTFYIGRAVHATTLVVADDDSARRGVIRETLARSLDVREVRIADLADTCRSSPPDAVLVATDASGAGAAFDAIERLRHSDPQLPVILLMQDGCERTAAAALRLGVKDYIPLPVAAPQLLAGLDRCVTPRRASPRAEAPVRSTLIGSSERMRRIRDYLARV